jgi:pyruvate kinase
MKIFKKTKIVATLGPVSETKEMIKKLIDAGMNVARLNFSHGDHGTHLLKIKTIKELISEGNNISIMLDTRGPEIRSHEFEGGLASFKTGDIVRISMNKILGNNKRFSVSYPNLIDDIETGKLIKFDDGKISFEVIDKDFKNRDIIVKALNPHALKDRRNCVAPFARLKMAFVSEQDRKDILFGCEQNINYIAASFTRRVDDVLAIKAILKEVGKEYIQIIAKIENQEGLDNLDAIISVADGIMVARGDLGVEIPPENVPVAQKVMISKAKKAGKPVIVATQLLESMMKYPTPTRAEVSDVANAILDVTDAVMLSGESASGDYPVESVSMEAKIANKMEALLDYHKLAEEGFNSSDQSDDDAIAFSVANSVLMTEAELIVAFSDSGTTTRRISKYRPNCPIVSVSTNPKRAKELTLYWGAYGITVAKFPESLDDFDKVASEIAKSFGVEKGQTIIITGGNGLGSTSFMKLTLVK